MSRPQKKPNYNSNQIMKNLLDEVSTCYSSAGGVASKNSLRRVSDEFDFTHLKVRKSIQYIGVEDFLLDEKLIS